MQPGEPVDRAISDGALRFVHIIDPTCELDALRRLPTQTRPRKLLKFFAKATPKARKVRSSL